MLSHSYIFALLSGSACAHIYRVLDSSFADPSVVYTGSDYYAFGTTGNHVHAQTAYSPDFVNWTLLDGHDALPGPYPTWVSKSSVSLWAPDVIKVSNNSYIMYYSAREATTGKHCVGAATSSKAQGPYNATVTNSSLACPLSQGGAIDPDGFIDTDGTIYVTYKIDGNSLDGDGTTHSTPIMLQKMHSDGITPDGDPIQLLDRSDLDGPLIEAPSIMLKDGIYYLSFSSNWYNTEKYDTSYGYATSITGPWKKQYAPYAPLLKTGTGSKNAGKLSAPGGTDFSVDGTKIVFHANLNGKDITKGRAMFVANITSSDNVISLA
ncbi:putative endo xylanase [Talaromyces proteolyticus]|uniref:Endo xylanase n=1 Tax=Talaromyces proteolyticus TaxID=1131652 RepID=A0AAD4KRY3_9EURO|nr:putative endo xylanase [Talaromyces proteolyticus]KAH8697077.1 putative endo xylanase [Talaromyces proteolyticus]